MCEEHYSFPVKVKEIREHEADGVDSVLTYVEIGHDHTKPDGIARNALAEEFLVHENDADWLALEAEAGEVKRYLNTLGIEYNEE